MILILFVSVSLLTQAYFFRNLDAPESNSQVNIGATYVDSVLARYSANVLTGENDSSRTTEHARDR